MSRNTRILLGGVSAVLLTLVLVPFLSQSTSTAPPLPSGTATSTSATSHNAGVLYKNRSEDNNVAPDPEDGISPLAIELNSEAFPPQHDVDVLQALLRLYERRLGHQQGLPIGNDSDLARALTGQNPMKVALLPSDHPALAQAGHLRDRWGTPYYVHPVANGLTEIRSAGPDRIRFTADDLIASPTALEE